MIENYKDSEIHWWRRCWARHFDYMLWIILIIMIAELAGYWINSDIRLRRGILIRLAVFPSWIPIEAWFIHKFRGTPGKWLTNIKIQNRDGSKLSYGQAWQRALDVCKYGTAFGIPILKALCMYSQQQKLARHGVTYYDAKGDFDVIIGKSGPIRLVLNSLLIILFFSSVGIFLVF